MTTTTNFRAGYVAVIGLPNAGKSTLVNVLVGEKVSIVTPKPQTTRQSIRGILSTPEFQAVFVDAPGLTDGRAALSRFMRREYQQAMDEADVLMIVLNLDAKDPKPLLRLIQEVKKNDKSKIFILSKSDRPQAREHALFLRQEIGVGFGPIIETSALRNGQQTKEHIQEYLNELLPLASQPLYPDDMYTTQDLRGMLSELVREKCFLHCHDEIPYGLAVRVLDFNEQAKIPHIEAEIVVTKENHRPIVVGAGGKGIATIGRESRAEFEKIYGRQIFLQLHVKVRENWMDKTGHLREFGYE